MRFANRAWSAEIVAPHFATADAGRADSESRLQKWARLAGAVVAFQLVATAALAQDPVEQFYRGKSINIYIGSAAGGGYDSYARTLGRHMGKYIPGNPTIVPQNMPGAGGNKVAGYVYSVAPKDGTAMGALFPGGILAPLLGDAPVQHDPRRFIYLGSANSDVYTCVVNADSPIKSFKDALTRELIIGASNEGGSTRDLPALDSNLLGAHFRIVSGYEGSRAITLALERREVDGICGFAYSGIVSSMPQRVADKTVRILVQEDAKGMPMLNKEGVPLTIDFAKTPEDRQAMDLVYGQGVIGRPFVLPEGVPPERVAALRKAFMEALADPELLAEAAKMSLDVQPISGEDVQAMVAHWFAMPPRIVERAKELLIYKGPQ